MSKSSSEPLGSTDMKKIFGSLIFMAVLVIAILVSFSILKNEKPQRIVCVTLNFDSSVNPNSYRAGINLDRENIGKDFNKDDIAGALLKDSSVGFKVEDVQSYDIDEGRCS